MESPLSVSPDPTHNAGAAFPIFPRHQRRMAEVRAMLENTSSQAHRVSAPRGAVEPGGAPHEAVPAREREPGRRVLIVDDHPDAAASLALLLRLAGNESRAVHDGLTALDEAERFRPDVVLLDIGMPQMDGYETCRRLRGQPWGGAMRVIAPTGWSREQEGARTREAGFDGHLVKPVDPPTLMRVIAEAPRSAA